MWNERNLDLLRGAAPGTTATLLYIRLAMHLATERARDSWGLLRERRFSSAILEFATNRSPGDLQPEAVDTLAQGFHRASHAGRCDRNRLGDSCPRPHRASGRDARDHARCLQ
jgi:hypothetical protein